MRGVWALGFGLWGLGAEAWGGTGLRVYVGGPFRALNPKP